MDLKYRVTDESEIPHARRVIDEVMTTCMPGFRYEVKIFRLP